MFIFLLYVHASLSVFMSVHMYVCMYVRDREIEREKMYTSQLFISRMSVSLAKTEGARLCNCSRRNSEYIRFNI